MEKKTRFIALQDSMDENAFFHVGGYLCNTAYEPGSITTDYALNGFFSIVIGNVYEDWLMEQSDDIQHIVEAFWNNANQIVKPVHYLFSLSDSGMVEKVQFFLERKFYLELPRIH